MSLTNVGVKSATPSEKPYKLGDAGGLYLLVNPNGTRWWRLKYRFDGKERSLALGAFPAVGLKEARDGRDAAKQLLRQGRDPGAERKAEKRTRRLATENSFEAIAREFVENQRARWTDEYADAMLRRLELNIFPGFGKRPITDIAPLELLSVLRIIEERGCTELAHRMQHACGQVFRYGVATGRCQRDVAADLRGALIPHIKQHQPAIKPEELPELLRAVDAYAGEPVTRLGLKMLALTFVRTAELIRAEWSEFDIDDALWTIPAERVKRVRGKAVRIDGIDHLVPLSVQALDVLAELRALPGNSRFVFASPINPRKPISENTLLYGLYRLGYHSRMTGHGFRAVASTILNEERERGAHNFGAEVIERQLEHKERNGARAAYNRAEHLQQRRGMMRWWADFLDRQRQQI
jgi:integrase